MDNPVFRLENVIKARDELEDFEGPLELILQLLSKDKIDIRDIQISVLLEQYLAYLDEMKSMDLEIASEFVSMASYLVLIKTKMLLNSEEEISELEQLMTSLESIKAKNSYKSIKAVLESLSEMNRRGAGLMEKPPEPLKTDSEYRYQHEPQDIYNAMKRVLAGHTVEERPAGRPFEMPKRITYSVTDKSNEMLERLKKHGAVMLKTLYRESKSRSEVVAVFISLLELCKSGRIYLTEAGEDLMITARGVDVPIEQEDTDGTA